MNNKGIQLQKIGTLYSPHKSLNNIPIQPKWAKGVKGRIVIKPQFVKGLRDLDGFSHIYLLCYLHKVRPYQLIVRPPIDNKPHGVFASRAPSRPNPISLSIVKLISIEDNVLFIENVDILDGTPVLDIKPYSPTFDVNEKMRFGWLEKIDDDR